LIGALISLPISLLSSWSYNQLVKPKIKITPIPISENEPTIHPRLGYSFYHLEIKNIGRTSAINADIRLTFKDQNETILFSISGKWDRSPEPLEPILPENMSSFFPSLIPLDEQINIRPNVPETFCIIVMDSNGECYAFNSVSYAHMFTNPNWQLTEGTYYLIVDIRGGNISHSEKIQININGRQQTDIEIINTNGGISNISIPESDDS
jgi:hypothetical protein